jgi:hypothetical protein
MIISIYNGFPFHFEVFGVFLDYLLGGAARVRIYTNMDDPLHWLDFYRARYAAAASTGGLEILPCAAFSVAAFHESTYVILATDDDPSFPAAYAALTGAAAKLVCYDHDITLRAPHIQRHITTRPYPLDVIHRRGVPYAYPVYPMMTLEEKRAALAAEGAVVNIVVVGGTYNTNHYWAHLLAANNLMGGGFRIFYMHRRCPGVWRRMDKYVRSICGGGSGGGSGAEIYEDCETTFMYSLLRRSHYMLILTDVDKFIHTACSGSIGLAFSTGCTLIMPRVYNTDYGFKSVLYYEDAPVLTRDDAMGRLDAVFEEQGAMVAHNRALMASLFSDG